MKIREVVVGTAGAENSMLHDEPEDGVAPRNDKRPPQVGYSLTIGNRTIGTPRYNPSDPGGTIGSITPG